MLPIDMDVILQSVVYVSVPQEAALMIRTVTSSRSVNVATNYVRCGRCTAGLCQQWIMCDAVCCSCSLPACWRRASGAHNAMAADA